MSLTAKNDELVFHPWSAQGPRSVPAFAGGSGSYLIDEGGRRYLDFGCQLVFTNLGHQHPRIVAAIKEQADRLCTLAPNYANDARGEAARLITEVAPEGLNHVFFTTGGTEAIEHATRMARQHTGRPKLLAAYRSYHGATATSIHLTGEPRRWPNDTGAAAVVHFFGPYLYRSAFGASTPEQESQRALEHLEQLVALEGPSTIAALVLESVIGSAGVIPPPPGYLAGVRELCTRYGIVYIADEVMVGFGRTGEWFGVDHAPVAPDAGQLAGRNSGVPWAACWSTTLPGRWARIAPGLPRRVDLLGAPARLRSVRRSDLGDARRRYGGGRCASRHGRPRPGPAGARRVAPLGRRRPRRGRLLGARARP